MIICIDVGNTNLTIGAYENGLNKSWRIDSNSFTYGKLIETFKDISITGICIGSVVPEITKQLLQLKTDYNNIPVMFYTDDNLDLIVNVPFANAGEVGADIILNGVAGINKYNSDLLVIDFGTATTFDVFKKDFEFIGTSIAPGVNLSLQSLTDNASQLPEIKIEPTDKVICQDTVNCMKSGIFWGYLSMIDGMIDKIKSEYSDMNFKVIATGGLADLYAKYTDKIEVVESNITLDGLNIIFERNKHLYD